MARPVSCGGRGWRLQRIMCTKGKGYLEHSYVEEGVNCCRSFFVLEFIKATIEAGYALCSAMVSLFRLERRGRVQKRAVFLFQSIIISFQYTSSNKQITPRFSKKKQLISAHQTNHTRFIKQRRITIKITTMITT